MKINNKSKIKNSKVEFFINIKCKIIINSLEHEDGEEIYSQDLQNYIKTFLTEEDILAYTFLNYGMVNKLLQISLQSIMIARRAIVEMMQILNPNSTNNLFN